jgi:hypothetical protein
VDDAAGNEVAIAGMQFSRVAIDPKANAASDDVTDLLVGMRVVGHVCVLVHHYFDQGCAVAARQCPADDARKHLDNGGFSVVAEHAGPEVDPASPVYPEARSRR